MNKDSNALLQELRKEFSNLQQLQKARPNVLRYLPKTYRETILSARTILTNGGGESKPLQQEEQGQQQEEQQQNGEEGPLNGLSNHSPVNDITSSPIDDPLDSPTTAPLGDEEEENEIIDLLDNPPKNAQEYVDNMEKAVGAINSRLRKVTTLEELDDLQTGILFSSYTTYYESLNELEESEINQGFYQNQFEGFEEQFDSKRDYIELESNNFVNTLENDVTLLETALENSSTLEDGSKMEDDLQEIESRFKNNTIQVDAVRRDWVVNMSDRIERLRANIEERVIELKEDNPEHTNETQIVRLPWVITRKSRDMEEKSARIGKLAARIESKLRSKYGEDDFVPNEDSSKRHQRLYNKLDRLLRKGNDIENDKTKNAHGDVLEIAVTFCKKQRIRTNSGNKLTTYWGIQQVNLPVIHTSTNNGGLSYNFTSQIDELGFSDILSIHVDLERAPATQFVFNWENIINSLVNLIPTQPIDPNDPETKPNWFANIRNTITGLIDIGDEIQIEGADTSIDWSCSISTDVSNGNSVVLEVTNSDEIKACGDLSYKAIQSVGTRVSYESNLGKANRIFMADARPKLRLSN